MPNPRVSFLIASYNRREVVLQTLARLAGCMGDAGAFEVLVVDNASADGTADAIAARFPNVRVLRQTVNRGPCAKNAGLPIARGEFVVFLDDDSFPMPGSIERMIGHFEADPKLGAAIFTVTLPDGRQECSAYPNVCIGCGTGFRRRAVLDAGGLPEDFFMQAEEYALSIRLMDMGWRVEPFGDLHVTHMKTPLSRFPARIVRLDARNNLMLALRYFPDPWRLRYAIEWTRRYHLMAIANGCRGAFWRGVGAGLIGGLFNRRCTVSAQTFEQFAKVRQTSDRLRWIATDLRLRKVLLVDLGKNVFAYLQAARACGVEVVGIADERLGGRGLKYHGLPILTDERAAGLAFDGAVLSNLSPVHARERAARWRRSNARRLIDLFQPEPATSGTALAA